MTRLKKPSNFWILFLVSLSAVCLLIVKPIAASDPVEFGLSWHCNSEAYLDGYEIYIREGVPGAQYELIGDVYVEELKDPDNPRVIITDLYNGVVDYEEASIRVRSLRDNMTYYFALTAFDSEGNTSDLSEEVCLEVAGSSATSCRSLGSGNDDDGSWPSNMLDLLDPDELGCFISATNKDIHINAITIACLFPALLLIIGLLRWRSNNRCTFN